MANLVKHGDLSVQQIAEIQKALIVSLRSKEAFWDKFCSHTAINDGFSSYKWRKLNIPKLKPEDVKNLTEGKTPAGLGLEYVAFSIAPVNYGTPIYYTDESVKYNFDDVVRDAKEVLGQRAFDESEIRKAKQFISGTCTMTLTSDDGTNNGFMKDLLKARTILRKNHIQPLNGGKYGVILAPEHAAEVLLNYKNQITHTSEKEAIINGYIGELAGFVLYENADPIMYTATYAKTADQAINSAHTYYTKEDNAFMGNAYKVVASPAVADIADYYEKTADQSYVLFLGKTEKGLPVQTVSFGDASVKVFNNGLGSVPDFDVDGNGKVTDVRPDSLHQRGSVGYKVMGFATRILHDEALIRGMHTLNAIWDNGTLATNVVNDADRKHYTGKSTSPAA